MKICKTVKSYFAILGICPSSDQSIQSFPFDGTVFCGFLLFGCLIFSHFVYIVQLADGFMEYMECACETSATIIMFVCFAAISFRSELIFENINNFEKLIDASTNDFKAFDLD